METSDPRNSSFISPIKIRKLKLGFIFISNLIKKKHFSASFSVLTKFIKPSSKRQSSYFLLKTVPLFGGSVKQPVCNKNPSRKWRCNTDKTLTTFRNWQHIHSYFANLWRRLCWVEGCNILVCFHYTRPDQEEVEEVFRQWKETKRSQALVFMGNSNDPSITHWGEQLWCWYDQQQSPLV